MAVAALRERAASVPVLPAQGRHLHAGRPDGHARGAGRAGGVSAAVSCGDGQEGVID